MNSSDSSVPGHDASAAVPSELPPLSWPPPGLEPIQGRLWRVIALLAAADVLLGAPLLWAFAVPQPFWNLGPFEGSWQIGLGATVLGLTVLLVGFGALIQLLRHAARAADAGYGSATIWEAATDIGRDTGFLIQGRRHFSALDRPRREKLVRARLRGAFFALAAALWLPSGLALALLLAARGWVGSNGIWVLSLGPTALLLAPAVLLELGQALRVAAARRRWDSEAGGEAHVREEGRGWRTRLTAAADGIALGGGAPVAGRSLRRSALGAAVLFALVLIPMITLALTAAVGPILADTAVPTFLSVQEMAGAAEALRNYQLEVDPSITPQQAGDALQNLVFVGPNQRPEPMERAPRASYPESWFNDPDVFPDPFSETVARDLIARAWSEFAPEERTSLQQAADHPAHVELERLAHASLADVASGRWTLPFADGVTMFDLPWPRFSAIRSAGVAHVARAAVELSEQRPADAEHTIREVISAGFLLVDEGPTLVDNLMGVVLVGMGGDALEALYRRTSRGEEAERIRGARAASTAAARMARVGNVEQDIHTLLRGIPDLVERDDALRGLRWEYLATFNVLAPCINPQKTLFGPDATYDAWMARAEDSLVRVPGEAALFALARSGTSGALDDVESPGPLARLLSLTLGTHTQPGSCARLLSGLELGGALEG